MGVRKNRNIKKKSSQNEIKEYKPEKMMSQPRVGCERIIGMHVGHGKEMNNA